jgi:prepilin-type N-terminal cleavage/methylation domain-containing protein
MQHQRGQTLIELLFSVAILGSIALIAGNVVEHARRRVAMAGVTSEFRATFMYVRQLAITRDRNVAIRFREEGKGYTWAVYEDGDGDGVRNDDITKKIDRELIAPRLFQHLPARIGLPDQSMPDPMNGGVLESRPAVRFNSSMLCSFSRVGEVTNGSVVLTDGVNTIIMRVYDRSGRIAVLRWNGKQWITGE